MLANGPAIEFIRPVSGSIAYRDKYFRRTDGKQILLAKKSDKNDFSDGGLFMAEYSHSLAVWCNKAYQILREVVQTFHPKKRPIRGILTCNVLRNNGKISGGRVVVENGFVGCVYYGPYSLANIFVTRPNMATQ